MTLEEKAHSVRIASEEGILRDIQNASVKAKVFGLHLIEGFDERIISKIKELDDLIDKYIDGKAEKAKAEADKVNAPQ